MSRPQNRKTIDYPELTHYVLAAMKTLIPITALAALVASSATFAQTPAYSKPSGYTTQVLKPNVTNYVGINVLTPVAASGSITAIRDSKLGLVDGKADFIASLQSGKMHTIEITSGSAAGHVREFVTWTKTKATVSLPIANLKAGDKYIIRKNLTLQQMFPQGAPLTGGATQPVDADIVRVPDGSGGFTQYFYKTTDEGAKKGWWTTVNGTKRGTRVTSDIPLLYTDGIQVVRKAGTNKNLVLTGQVKTTDTRPFLITGDNPVSINPPAGSRLSNSGLSSSLTGHATSPATADLLLIPQSNGSFKRYWYKNSTTGGPKGWYLTPNGTDPGTLVDATKVNLKPYCLIKRKGGTKFVRIKTPSFYKNL
jgi:hypothetical protein